MNNVSPPPSEAGEPTPESTPAPEPAAAEPAPQPEPPKPEPPRPQPPKPETPKPKPAPAKEPSPAPKATTKPPPKEAKPKAETPKSATPKEKPAPKAEPTPSKGARPNAASSGEGLDVQLKGIQCPSAAYCENIVRQLNRYFRPPANAANDETEVFFYINRDGSVSDIRVVRATGSFRFRAAAMEAVEQAGLNNSFGRIPRDFPVDRLPVSFYFRPAR